MRHWIAWGVFALAALLVALAGLAGLVNREVLDGPRFVANVEQVRQDPDVARAIGAEVADVAVARRADLVAVKPLIAQVAAGVVASDAVRPIFRVAATQAHTALTTPDSTTVVLRLADLGAVVTALLRTSAPEAAAAIPPDLPVTLSTVGGQGGFVGAAVATSQRATTLAWLLPALAIGCLALGVRVHPRPREAIHGAGIAVAAGGALLLVAAIGQQVWAASLDRSTLAGAAGAALLTTFGGPLVQIATLTLLLGGVVALITSATLPATDVDRRVRAVLRRAAGRPTSTGFGIARGLVMAVSGTALVLWPDATLRGLAVLAGVITVLYALDQLTGAARRARTREDRTTGTPAGSAPPPVRTGRPGWWVPAAAASVAVALVGALLAVSATPPRPVAAADATDPALTTCNGSQVLCDRRYDEVAFPAAHNAMTAEDAGFYLAEQPTGMVGLLDRGVRVLLIDTWYGQPVASGAVLTAPANFAAAGAQARDEFGPEIVESVNRIVSQLQAGGGPPSGPIAPYLCHTFCELGGTPLLSELQGVRAWMATHPTEVVTLFIQDAVTPADTAAAFDAAGLTGAAYVPAAPGAPWPTLRSMVETDRRLVVLMENDGGGAEHPWLLQGFDYVQDTGYEYPTVESFDCALNRGDPDASLFLVNHWLSGFRSLYTDAQTVNADGVLGARLTRCATERDRLPNYVAVNWVNLGDLTVVVDRLNGL
ncbi:hypothetical protein [Pengzhenrongella frigida]|uniref:Uncharacterized protein n=1 Tax=Pengzhenrongella frigida TaxID=1259133 RepID=A0A4Q5MZ18_9MICO|nr:hypothetical protein [Cellulomonas sp. HLT2-17]RYV50939.1 hypothetical protein EUA98_11180 [Cellulomonas sp. HLT2-17]